MMSSPFNPGRDSNADPSNAFGEYQEGQATQAGRAEMGFVSDRPSSRLGEDDYRS